MKVTFEPASNGVIKTTVDENINGNSAVYTETTVYELGEPKAHPYENVDDLKKNIEVINGLIEDLSLDIGNPNSIYKLSFLLEKNHAYMTNDDIDTIVEYHQQKIDEYNSLRKDG